MRSDPVFGPTKMESLSWFWVWLISPLRYSRCCASRLFWAFCYFLGFSGHLCFHLLDLLQRWSFNLILIFEWQTELSRWPSCNQRVARKTLSLLEHIRVLVVSAGSSLRGLETSHHYVRFLLSLCGLESQFCYLQADHCVVFEDCPVRTGDPDLISKDDPPHQNFSRCWWLRWYEVIILSFSMPNDRKLCPFCTVWHY